MQNANQKNNDPLESRIPRKGSVRFGGGNTETSAEDSQRRWVPTQLNITPTLPDGYNGPLKQLTCRTCHQVFYLTWGDYKRLGEGLSCHACRIIESQTVQLQEPQTSASSRSPFPTLLTVAQVATALHLGRTKVYELIWKEGLPVIRFGRSVRISPQALRTWLEQREHED